ncbi:serine hydrolase [Staphylococcus hyicus]|uniref:Serine hydrolase domain-containing protein n=2 Tax=Staphylococcus hyicus TaxID=1284 RepID=A0ACD5FPQ0_STAHY|nr:serine hydrolase domain-containing protein [Staphylococcus hyicus]AJC95185.1 0utative penicillin-binding protein [Staphylococcus hyicus]MCQ9291194.1 beta-lactamase family protein [Staphylococcus hyicus]MCQ9300068.1 beta-lactamase family protein [Staphylococcus hyicus]MCQ9306435.1 beta-lactamase family protein [Staphylococcus hyicus]MCQ9308848.1 beta-lactamase family protein [Staphylococcus hyicus]
MKNKSRALLKKVMIGLVAFAVLIGSASVYRYLKREHDQHLTEYISNQHKKDGIKAENIPRLKTVVDQKNVAYTSIDQYLKKTDFNGAIAIFDNGQLKMNKGYGFQDIEAGKANGPNTLFLIGSAQKFFTGMMIKKLELDDKINLNDFVDDYLPDFETNPKITLKDLMLHRSGLYKYEGSRDILDLDGAVQAIHDKGINPKTYHKHFYNDANYLVLSKVVEEVTQRSYTENYYKDFANPYNLNHSAFYNDVRYQNDMAKGYKLSDHIPVFKKPVFLDQYYGAGNLYMSPYDMGRMIQKLQTNQVFPQQETQAYIHEIKSSRYPENYRYGFYSFPDFNRVNGVFFGQTFTAYFNGRYTVVLATNYENHKSNLNETKIKHVFFDILKQPKRKK